MGNIQQYCGSNCLSKDSNMKLNEEDLPERNKTLNDYQEMCLMKGINAWKRILREKKDPFSIKNLTIKLKKLDEFIEERKGKFVDLRTFENLIDRTIFNLYIKLAIKEKKFGFKSFNVSRISPLTITTLSTYSHSLSNCILYFNEFKFSIKYKVY